MSYTTDAPLYKLEFTDGTFINMLNVGPDDPHLGEGQHEYIIPNFYMGDFDGLSYEKTKYDKKGNKYVFSERGVIINDTINFTRQASRLCLGYHPDIDELSVCYFEPVPEFIPYMQKTQYDASGICYGRDTSGTVFDTFGDALVWGEEKYNEWQPGFLVARYYNLENIVPRTKNIPLCGTTVFWGDHTVSPRVRALLYWRSFAVSQSVPLNLSDLLEDYDGEVTPIIDDDPYDPDDPTDPIGGWGDHDDSSDPIDIPSLPTVSAVDAGFITLYNPTVGQLNALANYMWSSPLQVWDNVKKIVANPMDCILGLSIVPVTPITGTMKSISVADVPTGVSARPITSQYVEVNCGTINVPEYWKAYLDYEPYTKAELYLPYIGIHPISIDDIMGKTVKVVYHVDLVSGSCTAYVKCGLSVLYSFIGQCASSIPIGGKDWTNVISGALTIATAIGSMVASGGMSAPMAGEAAGEAAGAAANEAAMTRAAMIRTVGHAAATAVNVIKPSIGKSGSMSGTGGLMAIQKPYLILTRPRQAVPASQNHFMGYPSFMTAVIGTLSGYTEMEHVHLDGINATDNEIAEIEQLLKGGVYL